MKNIVRIKHVGFLGLLVCSLISCSKKPILDYGNDRSLTGTIIDTTGKYVPSDIARDEIVVYVLGESETKETALRVKFDGTFGNTRLFHQKYKVWLEGPVFPVDPVADTIIVDFTKEKNKVLNWVVVPFLNIDLPEIVGDIDSTSVNISYNITGNRGMTASTRELYCSTATYPNTSTGKGPGYSTKEIKLKVDNGIEAVKGLEPGTKYHLRIGVKASGSGKFNFSDQITFTTKGKGK